MLLLHLKAGGRIVHAGESAHGKARESILWAKCLDCFFGIKSHHSLKVSACSTSSKDTSQAGPRKLLLLIIMFPHFEKRYISGLKYVKIRMKN